MAEILVASEQSEPGIGNPRLGIKEYLIQYPGGSEALAENGALDGKCKCGEKWKNRRRDDDEHI